jgi:hypothetical protein
MAEKLQRVGGARINRGEFEVYLTQDNRRHFLDPGPLRDFIQEYFMFLRSGEHSRLIAGRLVNRGTSGRGLPMASFQDPLGREYILYQKGPDYCVLVESDPAHLRSSEGQIQYSEAAIPSGEESNEEPTW